MTGSVLVYPKPITMDNEFVCYNKIIKFYRIKQMFSSLIHVAKVILQLGASTGTKLTHRRAWLCSSVIALLSLNLTVCTAASADSLDAKPLLETHGIYFSKTVLNDDGQPEQCKQYELKHLEDEKLLDFEIEKYIGIRNGYHMEVLLEGKQNDKEFFCAIKFTHYGKQHLLLDILKLQPFQAEAAVEVLMVEKKIAMTRGTKYFKFLDACPEHGVAEKKKCIHSTLHNYSDAPHQRFMQWLVELKENAKSPWHKVNKQDKTTLVDLLRYLKFRDTKKYKNKDMKFKYNPFANVHTNPKIHNCQTFASKAMKYLSGQKGKNTNRNRLTKAFSCILHGLGDVTGVSAIVKPAVPLANSFGRKDMSTHFVNLDSFSSVCKD